MLNIIFNIVGIGFILYALFILKSNSSRSEEEDFMNQYINDMQDFKQVLDQQVNEINKEEPTRLVEEDLSFKLPASNQSIRQAYENEPVNLDTYNRPTRPKSLVVDKKSRPVETSQEADFKQEVISLYNLGISKEEIAKKMKKSVREVDIVLKLNKIL